MSRIIYPTKFTQQKKLLEAIKAKHDSDGAASVLTTYLVQQNINLNDSITNANDAESCNNYQIKHHGKAENHNQQKKLNSKTPIANFKNEVQFLKKLYATNVRELSNWGITIVGKGRVKYPQNFTKLSNIIIDFFAKHQSFPAGTSPLQPFITEKNIDVGADKLAMLHCNVLEVTASEITALAADATQERNLMWQPILKQIKGIGNYLKSIYLENPYALGDYGFLVVETTRKAKMVTTKILLQQHKTIKGLVIGGKLINSGNVPIKIYKGKKISSQFIEVMPQESIEIAKGCSVVTVVNEDLLQTAVFSAQRII